MIFLYFSKNCLDLHPGNFSLSTPSILWFVSPTSKAPRRPRKVKVMSWPESKTENVAHVGADIFGNVFYRCLPSPATVYVLPECLEFRETFCLVGSDSCCWNCASIQTRRNSVKLLHGLEAALNDKGSLPICPFCSSPRFWLRRPWSHSLIRVAVWVGNQKGWVGNQKGLSRQPKPVWVGNQKRWVRNYESATKKALSRQPKNKHSWQLKWMQR